MLLIDDVAGALYFNEKITLQRKKGRFKYFVTMVKRGNNKICLPM